ncbi:hypothetical protein [Mucilaginibacter sp. SP1R1]|uniref:hypothetical protein n=1 Tax=Mucilaginibacter sp. SP1R1 TaxID=2723091 RepID=UPI001612CD6E|nr:hypothetical protein [Mucilaginibacter sp. SP1R1]MBB6151506.1 Spy/CpxP family protein refolding chaperone [Mucilaginibacter sp. SP1R1]
MKRFLLMCCLFIGLTTIVSAQTQAGAPNEKAKELQKKLKLTDAQTSKISAIYDESSKKFEKIKTEQHGDNAKMLVAIKPLRATTIQKIKAVLTKTQTVKYDKLLNDTKGAAGTGWGDGWSSPQ